MKAPSTTPPPGHARFPLIDGARALAAVSIVAFHLGSATSVNGRGMWGEVTEGLSVGVPLFFVISGFLLYRPFVAANLLRAPDIATKPYLWRRALRIVPLYWFVLTATLVLTAGSTDRVGGFFSGESWWVFYAFGQVYVPGSIGGGLEQAWTLCIEVTFYLLLPAYAVGVARLRRRGLRAGREVMLLCLLACASLLFAVVVVTPENSGYLARTLPSWFYLFAAGMILALVSVMSELRPEARLTRSAYRCSAFAWVGAVVLFCVQAWAIEEGDVALLSSVITAVIAGLLLTPAAFHDGRRTAVSRLLGHPSIAWLGLVSYGLYLWHPQVLSALESAGLAARLDGAGYLPLLAVFLLFAAMLAGATYYAIERPALSFKHRPPPGLRRRPATVTRQPDTDEARASGGDD